MADQLEWRQIAPFGAEVIGIDLSQMPSRAILNQLRQLYDEHHLLIFHGQNLTLEQQRSAAGWFGKLYPPAEGVNFISNTRKDGFLGNLELKFHSDLAHCEYPIESVMLLGVELDEGNTSTKFVSSTKAWIELPDNLKKAVENRRAVQCFAYGPNDGLYGYDENLPNWSHRIARPHPRTGEPCLYVMPESTRIIEGLPEEEGRPLLEALYAHIARPEAIYEHIWHIGDVVLWDNLACQHARGALNPDVPRTMQRATLGPLTFKQQYPALTPEAQEIVFGRLGAEPG